MERRMPEGRSWYRTWPGIAAVAIAAVAVVTAAVFVIVLSGRPEPPSSQPPSARADIAQWWSSAYPHVTDLQQALDDSRRALKGMDGPLLTAACQRMHDAAGVDLVAQLPAPDRDLTAALNAAAVDAHQAAHMCLAVLERTLNNYDAEFTSNVDQADRHLKAAVAIVNRNLT
ncbi:hypothetical protein [Mycobacterium sp. SMC-4]|uniref:hypothetical protein n=1 Tax=Mycobacterium sp. SMC-4 TaxID=2857059 RepID=UPI0021B38786|nr:hypothetical protein [Mycobacterium sp. SMC-4]